MYSIQCITLKKIVYLSTGALRYLIQMANVRPYTLPVHNPRHAALANYSIHSSMYRAWFSPASYAQRVEFLDVLGGFRYALGTVLGYKSAVLVEDLDLRMGLVELLQAHAAIDIEQLGSVFFRWVRRSAILPCVWRGTPNTQVVRVVSAPRTFRNIE